jgi:hypothetical protein
MNKLSFDKINEVQANIVYEGCIVGTLERNFGFYSVWIYHKFFKVHASKKDTLSEDIRSQIEFIRYEIHSEEILKKRGFKILA